MSIGQMISSDSHIIEPPDLWTTRLDRALRDHGPRAVEIDGQQWWVLNNMKGLSFAGGAQTGDRFTEATAGYNYLRRHGVPDEAIRKEVQGRTTYESLAAVARFLRTEEIDDVVLVSGPAHAKRLAGIADSVGLHAAISPSDGSPDLRSLVRETVAVSVGRLVGYRRLERLDH